MCRLRCNQQLGLDPLYHTTTHTVRADPQPTTTTKKPTSSPIQ
jgi:hypothetical protein